MTTIGFIGTGHIAAPMARAVAREGHRVLVSERNAEVAAALVAADLGIEAVPNQTVLERAEVVFLCLRPAIAPSVLPELTFRAGQKLVSVMAGISMADLQSWCAPAEDICQTIPLGYLEEGGCPLAVYPHGRTLEPLLGARNPVIEVASEAALNQHFAVCALVPGILDLLATASGWLAEHGGDRDAAEIYTTQLLSGFLAAMPREGAGQLAAHRDALATPNTLSLMMTEGLREGGVHEALAATMDAIGRTLSDGK